MHLTSAEFAMFVTSECAAGKAMSQQFFSIITWRSSMKNLLNSLRTITLIQTIKATVYTGLLALAAAAVFGASAFAQAPQSRFADVNGIRIHYLVSGKG